VIGRFLFGVLSGTALVICGLVLAAALSPLTPPGQAVTNDAALEPTTEVPAAATIPDPSDKTLAENQADAAESVPVPETPATETPATETPAPGPVEDAAAKTPATDAETLSEIPPVAAAEVLPEVSAAGLPKADADPTLAEAALEPSQTPAPQPEVAAQPDVTETAQPDPQPAPLDDPEIAAEAEPAPEPDPAPLLPDPNRTEDGVIIGRLPRIGDAPADAGAAGAAPVPTTPLVAFAASFQNPDKKPVFAIVLIDPGTPELDREGLAALPFPVSFALDPLDPASDGWASVYRAGGKEVVMLATGIAVGAQASDVEVAFQSMAQGLPEAVAVMDSDSSLFQNNRAVASLIVPVIKAQGRGLLTWDTGLNAADQVARREDVPAAVVFRDLAVSGLDGAAIQRILGRAIFKAGQDGRVVVAATATPDLVAALLEWSVEGKSASVALAPLSAVLTVE